MGRKRLSPWFRESDQCWYTTVDRKSVRLGTASEPKKLIDARFRELVALAQNADRLTVRQICSAFLAFNEQHRSAATHKWYKGFLDTFTAFVKPSLTPEQLTPSAVNKWIEQKYGKRAPSTKNGAARSVVRMFNWAVDERLIDRTPMIGFTKPAASSRETTITPAEYQKCLRHAPQPIRDVIKFIWHTGCRPQEVRVIESRWIDAETSTIVLPAEKSKGKKKRRVIYMDATAKEIAIRLAVDNLNEPMFRNSRDKPWTKGAILCAFRRLKKKTKIEGLCAYAFRHGFATETLKRGVDTTTVSVLMGNSPRMVADVYQHVADDRSYLLGIVNAAR